MSTDRQVTCINKTNRTDPHERISHIGGSGWRETEATAISQIEGGTHKYWASGGGKSVWIIVASRNGRKYLKTENDGVSPDNLLSLSECR